MKSLAVGVVAIFLAGCASTSQQPAAPAATATTTDPDTKAAQYVGALTRWSLEPEAWLKECNKIDAPGAQGRQAIYDAWLESNKNDLSRVKELRKSVGDAMFPDMKAQGAEPSEAIRAKVTIDLYKVLYFMDQKKKSTLCSSYAALPPLDASQSSGMRNEAFMYLDGWLAARQSR